MQLSFAALLKVSLIHPHSNRTLQTLHDYAFEQQTHCHNSLDSEYGGLPGSVLLPLHRHSALANNMYSACTLFRTRTHTPKAEHIAEIPVSFFDAAAALLSLRAACAFLATSSGCEQRALADARMSFQRIGYDRSKLTLKDFDFSLFFATSQCV